MKFAVGLSHICNKLKRPVPRPEEIEECFHRAWQNEDETYEVPIADLSHLRMNEIGDLKTREQLDDEEWQKIFTIQSGRDASGMPCAFCGRLHKGLCAQLLIALRGSALEQSARYGPYCSQYGVLPSSVPDNDPLQPFTMIIPWEYDDVAYGTVGAIRDLVGFQKSIHFEVTRQLYPVSSQQRVDPRFNRELDLSLKIDPEIRKCFITSRVATRLGVKTRECWVSVALIKFLLRRDLSSVNLSFSAILANFQRSTASSDYIHFPYDLSLNLPGLISDSQLYAASLVYKVHYDRQREIGILQENGQNPPSGQSCSGSIGQTGESSQRTASLTRKFVCILAGAATVVAASTVVWCFARFVRRCQYGTDPHASPTLRSMLGLKH
jgi:hypothetical protein